MEADAGLHGRPPDQLLLVDVVPQLDHGVLAGRGPLLLGRQADRLEAWLAAAAVDDVDLELAAAVASLP